MSNAKEENSTYNYHAIINLFQVFSHLIRWHTGFFFFFFFEKPTNIFVYFLKKEKEVNNEKA